MKTFLIILFLNIVLFGYTNAQWKGRIDITSSENTQFIVTSPLGYKTGYDPRSKSEYSHSDVKEDIPESQYSLGVNSSLEGDDDVEYSECTITLSSTDAAGKYRLLVINTSLDKFWINVWCSKRISGVMNEREKFLIEGVLDRDSTLSYDFVFPMNDEPYSLQKNVSINSIRQDIYAMRKVNWISTQVVADKYTGLFATYNTQILQNNFGGARTTLNTVIQNLIADSTASITSGAYKSLRSDTDQLLNQLPPSGCNVKLVNSNGTKLTSGSLQYYDVSWKDAVNNNDGTFSITTNLKTLSLRMTYEYGTQTKSNVSISTDTIVFQTVNTQVQLQNSLGTLTDTGTVQYYAGAWRSLGTTINGIASKELLPGSYSFRMTYANASKDKQQDVGANPIVVFKTVNAQIQLQNSSGTLIDTGTVQYYSGSWLPVGTTSGGVAAKELLPNSYSFRMTYASASKDKQQDISTNPTVVFQTVKAQVQLQNSSGSLIDTGTVQYYSGAWLPLGTTVSGIASKELLPNSYSFRMNYAYASKDKQQDIGSNATVIFQTVNTAVQLKNSSGALIDTGTVQYYSGAWQSFGTTVNGAANKELLPNSYSFRMTYTYASLDKTQDLSTNSTVSFSTVLCTIQVKNSQSQLIDNALASYYSGAWRQIGNTVNGIITKELLPVSLSFRVKYGTQQIDKTQNLSTNKVVEFVLQ